jgi:HSP20 family molecular chaperone IbpA
MAEIPVKRVAQREDRSLPVFKDVEKLMQSIRERAFNMFAGRGFETGHALDDWLRAEHEFCWPAARLVERDKEYEVEVALPGYETDEVEVTCTPRELLIHARPIAKAEPAAKVAEARSRWSTFGDNDVFRRVEFGADIDVSRVTATFRNGMLIVALPKTLVEPRKIPVAAAA